MNKRYVAETKIQRTQDASDWLKVLESNPIYKEAIKASINMTKYVPNEAAIEFNINVKYNRQKDVTNVKVFNNDVAICAKAAVTRVKYPDKVCVLNFASYTNPGGGYLTGALSQEESICRMSGLYPILKEYQSVYTSRRENKDRTPLYSNDYIYSREVPFIINGVGKVHLADVITIAAPNIKAFSENRKLPVDSISVLKERMEVAFTSPYTYGCSILLLGAFGCGAFGNDPEVVAKYWDYLTKERYPGMYKEIVHPVFDSDQCKVFKKYCL